nr:hypothetical protein CFP56_16818 [Quercus suber]
MLGWDRANEGAFQVPARGAAVKPRDLVHQAEDRGGISTFFDCVLLVMITCNHVNREPSTCSVSSWLFYIICGMFCWDDTCRIQNGNNSEATESRDSTKRYTTTTLTEPLGYACSNQHICRHVAFRSPSGVPFGISARLTCFETASHIARARTLIDLPIQQTR